MTYDDCFDAQAVLKFDQQLRRGLVFGRHGANNLAREEGESPLKCRQDPNRKINDGIQVSKAGVRSP